ncbi:MAG: exodeoxyribonuclease VII large subunit [Pelagibacterales bacterium]|nr:exodeoxyribonuclease VII large subunit [Pelagibacterales bacterium]OUU63325.1 MAG: exodeoxyribonuclease VII large subunit [Alphaproteobacteria bacterium TMED62]|tara:strand:- start:3824 stop:5140 length:1317 start_codon:yes stop_codon:yes gene_type:complete
MSNIIEYTVSEISFSIKTNLESQFSRVKIKGEISGLTKAKSGHIYLTLKDEEATLSSIIWKSRVSLLEIMPEEGLEVIALGKISTYMPRSNYNFIIENISFAGEGALLKLIEQRKKKLENLGFFSEKKKKKLPYIPNKIGIITSPTGAVIEDMKKRIKERFPSNILLWSVAVQGNASEKEIENAIKGFNLLDIKPDVIILARGGGSLEDLMSFNSEKIAIAIYESKIPIISAVGHETDFSISDFVADSRASTPTAAADMVVPEKKELWKKIQYLSENKKNYLDNLINLQIYKLDTLEARIVEPKIFLSGLEEKLNNECEKIKSFISNYMKRVESLINNMNLLKQDRKIKEYNINLAKQFNYFKQSFSVLFKKKSDIMNNKITVLQSSSYERWLEKGFVFVKGTDNKLIKNLRMLKNYKDVILNFSDGKAIAKIKKYDD